MEKLNVPIRRIVRESDLWGFECVKKDGSKNTKVLKEEEEKEEKLIEREARSSGQSSCGSVEL